MNRRTSITAATPQASWALRSLNGWFLAAALAVVVGCGTSKSAEKKTDFFHFRQPRGRPASQSADGQG